MILSHEGDTGRATMQNALRISSLELLEKGMEDI